MDRECYKCVYHTNTCTKWGCQFETLEEHDKQIRATVIEEVEKELLSHGFIFTEHALEVWHGIAEQLKGE